ncbi:group 1 truncated hemoglobin [Actimicrobium sp. CCI2.3]|uniref:group I truncated hemoglobin n=1 Tax=Actimicrobium sp. CCI2.3 TaxID=3048616 RepID=UPI002AB59D29|nr:group 1 truncated hemoglobin [Actimicrobium sp. CCI2.3]MDY7573241.1 group 1 truncated hemoglobin [Actimicrobium sp. CCI2.3]MEB0022875.1 group 1 truncated hemoglobin [Actimicrobium sp. CCI2.3]
MKRFAMLCLLLALGSPALAADEVYQGLGQQPGIDQVVETFVTLLQADHRVGHSFVEADLPHLKEKLAEQFCVLAGGPCRYTGKEMATIHDGLNITVAQFYALVEDLQIAMERHGIASRVQNKLLAGLAPMQRDVVTR